jgi:hypothetical protein
MKIAGKQITLGVVIWTVFIFILGGVTTPVLNDVGEYCFKKLFKAGDISAKTERLKQRHEEDLKVWEDSVRLSLDAKYAPELKRLNEKLQGVKGQRGSTGIESYYRGRINGVINQKEAEFKRQLEIKKRGQRREIEDLESE